MRVLGICSLVESSSAQPTRISPQSLHWSYTTDPDSRAWERIDNVSIDCHAENEAQLARLRYLMQSLSR